MYTGYMHAYIDIHVCIQIHAYICTHICMFMYVHVCLQFYSSQGIDDKISSNLLRKFLLIKTQRQKIQVKEVWKKERNLIHKEHICHKQLWGTQMSHSLNACELYSFWNDTVWAGMYKMATKYWWEIRLMAPNHSGYPWEETGSWIILIPTWANTR